MRGVGDGGGGEEVEAVGGEGGRGRVEGGGLGEGLVDYCFGSRRLGGVGF